ncbi:hypothetical protein EDD11_005521 [Mortierella claussenii]|nr:hypothetical protein EDD11_005521 [Mortierella claussenii]
MQTPFSYTQFGAVLMVDIVGFSQASFYGMTSIASSKGDVGAEMLSSQIGAYFDMAIRIIEYHGGDVVKFLGDALLVVFQADPFEKHPLDPEDSSGGQSDHGDSSVTSEDNSTASLRRHKIIVRKAIECGLELLAQLSHYRIYLSEREFSRKLSEATTLSCDSANNDWGINYPNEEDRGDSGIQNNEPSSTDLDLLHSIGQNSGPSRQGITTGGHSAPHPLMNVSNASDTSNDNYISSAPSGALPGMLSKQSFGSDGPGAGRESKTSQQRKITSTRNGDVKPPPPPPPPPPPLRFYGGTGPGPVIIPSFHINTQTSTSDGQSSELRRREDPLNPNSSKPGSVTSKAKAGLLFTARALLNHANLCDKQGSNAAGEALAEAELAPEDSYELQLHMALSAGDISNIIIGKIEGDRGVDNLLVQSTDRLEYAICGEQMSMVEDALNLARAGEVTITKDAWDYVDPKSYPESEVRRNCIILRRPDRGLGMELPLLRRVRNERLFNTPVEDNPHYFKYINKSAIHRLILYPDGAFPAQFRNATILFVSLGDVKPWTAEGLALCQKAIVVVQEIIATYVGFIQQFAVDDKGATILNAFGLPYPRSHEKEAIFAAKAAWMIRQRFLEEGISGFRISLATGVIFTSSIGNEFRRDPAIVGDTIVVAVRILKFEYALESIVCDNSTMLACTSDNDSFCVFEDMGEEYVKGKLHPLHIWRLVHFGARMQIRRPNDVMVDETIGYEPEREKVSNFISAWSRAPDRNTLLVSGSRGSGKCMFYQQIGRIADKNGYYLCSATSTEVEQDTEYYSVKFLLLGLFDIMRKREIPYILKRAPDVMAPVSAEEVEGALNTHLGLTSPRGSIRSARMSKTTTHDTSPLALVPTTSLPTSPLSSVTSKASNRPSHGRLSNHRQSNTSSTDESLSPSVRQYEQMPQITLPTEKANLQSLISMCLDKIGDIEHNLSIPALSNIIAAISSNNSAPNISAEDDRLLTGFIVRALNFASHFVKIIIMFEGIQWCDDKSLSILQAIHERCPLVLVVVLSRPLRDYGGGAALKALTNHPKHLEIVLEGLKPREVEQALLRMFKPSGVSRISPEILELVQEKTKGNPKLVKNMSMMLSDFCHINIVDGELLTTGKATSASPSSKSLEELSPKQDYKKVTLMKYDRVRPKFQDFLKIASCLGEKFSLAEVNAIKPVEILLGKPDQNKSYATAISDLDTFRFLSLATDQQMNLQFSANTDLQTVYVFGSPSTAIDIYESIPYEERVGYHLKMGQFYESFLDQQAMNKDPADQPLYCQNLLPQITYHYMKTDVIEKKIKYLKALAAFNLKSNMLTDSTDNINQLIHILDTEPGARDMVSDEDLADIYGMKGESLSKRMRIEEAEPALLDSLAMYGIHWPSTKGQWKRKLLKEGLKFKYYYRCGFTPVTPKSKGKPLKVKGDAKTQLRLSRLLRVLACLQNIFFWRTQPEAAMLSSLYTLSCSRKLGVPCGDQTCSLARIAIILYFRGNKRGCEKYMSDARRRNEAGETTGGMMEAMDAYAEYGEGRQAQAHRLLDVAISESKTFGIVMHLATFYRAVTQKVAYRMWEGSLNVNPEDSQLLRTLSAVAIQNGDSEGETLFAIPTLANLLIQDRLREAESWISLVEKFIMPRARLMNLLAVHGVLSFYYAKIRVYEKSRVYLELLAQRIKEQAVGAHPFPLLSCFFALMAMYEMYNSAPTKPGSRFPEMTPICSTRGGVVLTHVIAYLKTDPLKLISEPLICLADAMGSLLTPGHEKEGGQKLARGYFEMSRSLEGVNFVKAYFLTQLGRQLEPHKKSAYYKRAYRLFVSMSMDPLIWLTDPTSTWEPPPVDEASGGFHRWDESPVSRQSDVPRNKSMSWTSLEALQPTISGPVVGPETTQDEMIGMKMLMSGDIKLNVKSFTDELATASVSTAPTVYDTNARVDPRTMIA